MLVGINYDRKTKKHECHIEKWKKTQVVKEENSGSSEENSGSKREKSRSNKVEKIVGYCSEPRTLEEIASFMGVKDKNYMKSQYIDPVLGTRLRMTEPYSPTSPTQKYVIITPVDKSQTTMDALLEVLPNNSTESSYKS